MLIAKLATGEMAFDDVWWGGKVKVGSHTHLQLTFMGSSQSWRGVDCLCHCAYRIRGTLMRGLQALQPVPLQQSWPEQWLLRCAEHLPMMFTLAW